MIIVFRDYRELFFKSDYRENCGSDRHRVYRRINGGKETVGMRYRRRGRGEK
jgi:hypothetical protein